MTTTHRYGRSSPPRWLDVPRRQPSLAYCPTWTRLPGSCPPSGHRGDHVVSTHPRSSLVTARPELCRPVLACLPRLVSTVLKLVLNWRTSAGISSPAAPTLPGAGVRARGARG